MFKGLKSKLEDEAKRLQQYGENLASQVRSSASDAGSDIGGRGKKFIENALNSVQQPQPGSRTDSTINDDTIISLNDDNEANTSNSRIGRNTTIPSRQRHFSNTSMESNESSFSALNLPPHVKPTSSLLEIISSDVESNMGSVPDLSSLEAMPSDRLTSIFQRLEDRAMDYKNKYRELVKAYREIERENEKCRSVLSATQDKALKRITKLKEEKSEYQSRLEALERDEKQMTTENASNKKLHELLVKCKDEITANRERISALTDENGKLKQGENSQHTTIERISAEWKGRFDRQEEEWTKRLTACEEKATIAIATSKAEMHSTLQQKDHELEKWIAKCHNLEKQDEDANVRWQGKVDGLQKGIVALEQEKQEMIQKLSQAKQEGVKLVKESEERRYSDILVGELKKKDEEWGRRVKELEEQMQLAVEEHDMQRKTSMADYDRVMAKLRERVEELEMENARILLDLRKQEDKQKIKEEEIQRVAIEQTDDIENRLEKLNAKLLDEQKRSSEFQRKIRLMEEENGNILEEKEQLMVELEAKDNQMEKSGKIWEEEKAAIEVKLEEKIAEMERKMADKAEDETMKEHLNGAIRENKALCGENLALQKETSTLKEELQAHKNKIKEQQKNLEEIQTKLEEMMAKSKETKETDEKDSELKQKLDNVIIERKTLSIANSALQSQIFRLQEEIQEQRVRCETLEGEIGMKERQNSSLEKQMDELKSQKMEKDGLEEKLKMVLGEKESLFEAKMTLEKEVSVMKENIQTEKNRTSALQNELEIVQTRLRDIDAVDLKANEEGELVKKKLREINAEREALSETNSTLQKEISFLKEEVKQNLENDRQKDDTIQKLEIIIANLKESLTDNEANIWQIQSKFDKKKAENAKIIETNTTLEETKKQLAEKADELEKQLEAKQNEMAILENKLKRYEEEQISRETNMDQQISELTSELEMKSKRESRLSKEFDEAKNEFDQSSFRQKEEIKELREALVASEEAKIQFSLEIKAANHELRKFQQLEQQIKEKSIELEKLRSELVDLKSLKDEASRKEEEYKQKIAEIEEAQRKAVENARKEADKTKQKAITDLQSEIRQLYNSVNEKDCELAANHATIAKLEYELGTLRAEMEQPNRVVDRQQSKDQLYCSFGETVDLDEVLELKRRLADQEEELQQLKLTAPERNGLQKEKRELKQKMSITSDHLNFAEPTEAEYLRNVIYRYMTERENLGRESVTLAKVICTVCKFPPEQLNLVLRREEARCQSWIPASSITENAAKILQQRYATSSGHNRLDYDRM